MEDFKIILLDLVKYQNTQQLQVQERMEETWQKQLLSQQEKIEKLLLQIQKGKSRETTRISKASFLNWQAVVIPSKMNFLFSQSAIWRAIENFSYSPEEDVAFKYNFRRYEDFYTSDCANWRDS